MALAPELYMKACLRVLYVATTYCRNMAAGKEIPYKQIEDLMDAVNHIPEVLAEWERFEESVLLTHLGCYDEKWASHEPRLNLRAVYENALRSASSDSAI